MGCKENNMPVDEETVGIYSGLSEQDIESAVSILVNEGVVEKKTLDLVEGFLLALNYSE